MFLLHHPTEREKLTLPNVREIRDNNKIPEVDKRLASRAQVEGLAFVWSRSHPP